jgi:hypothetical protein
VTVFCGSLSATALVIVPSSHNVLNNNNNFNLLFSYVS